MRCPKCGTENDDEVAFCVYCGSLLPDQAPTPSAPVAPSAASSTADVVRAMKPAPAKARAFPEHRPDFVGLIGVAVIGIDPRFLLNLGESAKRGRLDG